MNKELVKKLEKQLEYIKNSKSDYEKFISKFKDMIGDDEELLDWLEEIYKTYMHCYNNFFHYTYMFF